MRKILIVYYSLFGSTKEAGEEIAELTGGSLRELVPDKNYSFDYNTAVKEVRAEISRGCCPKLSLGNEAIADYHTIFIGTPNWFKTMAPPVLSFLRHHDFAGITVIPFCTHGGGGFGSIQDDMAKECKGAVMCKGLALSGTPSQKDLKVWLETVGI